MILSCKQGGVCRITRKVCGSIIQKQTEKANSIKKRKTTIIQIIIQNKNNNNNAKNKITIK